MRQLGLLLALFLGGTSSCSSSRAPSPATSTAPDAWRSELLFADSQEGLESGNFATHLNFGPLRDLWFRAKVPAMPRVSMLMIQFVSPQGQPFYTDSFPFSPDPAMNEMTMPTAPHPVTVMQAKTVPGGFVLDHHIPIAGTDPQNPAASPTQKKPYSPPKIIWREPYQPVAFGLSCAKQPGNPECNPGPTGS